jgi:NADH:ubiquinone oxidoreductase subunit K
MAAMTAILTSVAAIVALKEDSLSISNPQASVFILIPAAVAVAVAILSTMFRELEKTKMSKLSINFAGLKAEFVGKSKQAEETLNKKSNPTP